VSTRGEGRPASFTIAGRVYPALVVGDHDGEPFARLPLENGLVVEAYGWSDADEVSLFLVGDEGDGSEDPDLCWTEVVTGEEAVATIAEWSRWTAAVARRWRAEHGHAGPPEPRA
jgi:hypothetical protein